MKTENKVNILENRQAQKWSRKQLLGRGLWALGYPLFTFSPRPLWDWRRFMFRCFGVKISAHVRIHPSVRITIPWNLTIGPYTAIGDRAILYALGPIIISASSTVSQYAHICAGSHDFRDRKMTLTKPPITIGDDVWVCADAFIGPDVVIGDRALIGARTVITRNVAPNVIMVGNPARVRGPRYLDGSEGSV